MKKGILWTALDSIFLILFNAFFFILGDTEKHNFSVWLSYGFIHFAYLMLIITPILTHKGKHRAVLGFPLYVVSSFYFLTSFVLGVIIILINPEEFRGALLVQLCVAGLYAIILIANLLANEHTAKAVEKQQQEIAYIKDASAELKRFMDKVSDKKARKAVEKAYDALSTSPVKSHPELERDEREILRSVEELRELASGGNAERIIESAGALTDAVNERNAKLKRLN
jgi:heme exporter protein D